MKLIIQIPCYNEEKTLSGVLSELPKKIKGIDKIEIQVIDDGSTDGTLDVAKKFGVNNFVIHKVNRGLGVSFNDGVEDALRNNADILVNTDGDNQYPGKYIGELVRPIVEGEADMVIADRQTRKVDDFSFIKKVFQALGSFVVRHLSGTDVPDAVSGFRAYSRKSLIEINPITSFSYCIDTIIQAGRKGLKVVSIPIRTNRATRKSRLFKNIGQHIWHSSLDLIKVLITYEPFKTFLAIGILFLTPALIFAFRYLFFYLFMPLEAKGHVQSLVLASAFFVCFAQMLALGILGDLVGINRRLMERILKIEKENVK